MLDSLIIINSRAHSCNLFKSKIQLNNQVKNYVGSELENHIQIFDLSRLDMYRKDFTSGLWVPLPHPLASPARLGYR